MATPCFIANWKMNKTLSDARSYLKILQKRLPEITAEDWEMILAPPFTSLAHVYEFVQAASLKIALAGQNFHFGAEGAYTGEISSRMLHEIGCRYVIVGHSERRVHFGETDKEVACKVAEAQIAGLIPILCVGESLPNRKSGKTVFVIKRQIKKGFDLLGLSKKKSLENGFLDLSDCIVAYEPVWAIGTGKTPTPKEVEEVHQEIAAYLISVGVAQEGLPRILYGGSVNEKNVVDFMKEPHIDGVLAGGASLSAETFVKMIEAGLYAKEEMCTS